MYSNQYNSSQYGYSGGGGSVGGYQSSNYGSSGVSQLILGNDWVSSMGRHGIRFQSLRFLVCNTFSFFEQMSDSL